MGEPTPRLIRLFVFLTQTDPGPKFSGRTGLLALLCRLSALPASLSTQVFLGYSASRCSCQPFWPEGAWSFTQQWTGGESLLQEPPQFFCSCRESVLLPCNLGFSLKMGWEIILLEWLKWHSCKCLMIESLCIGQVVLHRVLKLNNQSFSFKNRLFYTVWEEFCFSFISNPPNLSRCSEPWWIHINR